VCLGQRPNRVLCFRPQVLAVQQMTDFHIVRFASRRALPSFTDRTRPLGVKFYNDFSRVCTGVCVQCVAAGPSRNLHARTAGLQRLAFSNIHGWGCTPATLAFKKYRFPYSLIRITFHRVAFRHLWVHCSSRHQILYANRRIWLGADFHALSRLPSHRRGP
jgi:hypothetical protein